MENLSSMKVKPVEFHASTQIEAESFDFSWTVKQFSFFPKNEEFYSPLFNENEETSDAWRIQVKPYNWVNCYEFFSVYLERVQYGEHQHFESTEIKVKFQIILVDQDGGKNHSFECSQTFKGAVYFGWTNFISIANLRTPNKYIKNDTIKLMCKLTLIGQVKHQSWNGNADENFTQKKMEKLIKDEIIEDFSLLYDDNTLADVKIITSEDTIMAHKIILCARSPVFKSMFSNSMIESTKNEVKIEDFDKMTIRGMLEFMYKGETELLEQIPADLLQIANKYEMHGLKKVAEIKTATKISIENAKDILIVAELHNASYLKSRVINFIKKNRNNLRKVSKFNSIDLLVEGYELIDISSP